MSREDDIRAEREWAAIVQRGSLENMHEMESNEGHGFPHPVRDADSAMVECAKLLKFLTGLLQQFAAGAICGRFDIRLWPPGCDFRIEVRK